MAGAQPLALSRASFLTPTPHHLAADAAISCLVQHCCVFWGYNGGLSCPLQGRAAAEAGSHTAAQDCVERDSLLIHPPGAAAHAHIGKQKALTSEQRGT